MFYSYYSYGISLLSVDFSNFDTSNSSDINSMFKNCSLIKLLQGAWNFDTYIVTDMNSIFPVCSSLVSDSFPDILNWETSKVLIPIIKVNFWYLGMGYF